MSIQIDGDLSGTTELPSIYRGADYLRTYSLSQDLTGYTVTCKFASLDYSSTVFTATVTITDAAAGDISVAIDSVDTAAATVDNTLPSGYGFIASSVSENGVAEYQLLQFDVLLDDGSGGKTQAVRGVAKLYDSATV